MYWQCIVPQTIPLLYYFPLKPKLFKENPMGNPLLSKVLWHQHGTHFFITVYNQLTTITNIPPDPEFFSAATVQSI